MATKRKKAVPIRRSPRQARAQATVEAILGAAAQILERRGRSGFTTNAIAERAGVSIGTLYQYFPDKAEILLALAKRFLAEDRAAVFTAIQQAMTESVPELDRAAIREGMRRYELQPKVRRIVMETMIGLGRLEEVSSPVQDIGALLSQSTERVGLDEAAWNLRLFVGTRAVEAVIRAAAYENKPFFATRHFEDELVLLARGLLPQLVPRR